MRAHGALCALALIAIACGAEPTGVPRELLGIWRNPNPEFRESYFELREGWVLFGADRFQMSMYPVHRVESAPTAAGTEYRIEYLAEDGDALPLVLVHQPGPRTTLQVGRRPDRWVPESEATWLAKETR